VGSVEELDSMGKAQCGQFGLQVIHFRVVEVADAGGPEEEKWGVAPGPTIVPFNCALASPALAHGNGGARSAGHGNSAFGHMQGSAATRTKGSVNSQFGKNRAAAAKARSAARRGDTNRGNSAFGHMQGDPATRTTGQVNSTFGQNRAAEVKQDAMTPTP
jgi:hypothetical protein